MSAVRYLIVAFLVWAGTLLPAAAEPRIERVISPGGLEVWLVRDRTQPIIALNFAFAGGSSQDPKDKPGVAALLSSLLDEGAGDLDAAAFARALEESAMELSFSAGRDHFSGGLRTLTQNLSRAEELARLALNAPRFDAPAVERMRTQTIAQLRRALTSPNDIASRTLNATAFPDHPYGRPSAGTLESVPTITVEDLRAYQRNILTRDGLKLAAVGDIDAARLGVLVDKIFGALPTKGTRLPVPVVEPQGLGRTVVVEVNVPQSVTMLAAKGIARNDPDFLPAFVLNHIFGGGSFSSRLYTEVREKRGLAYSVWSGLSTPDATALLMGGTATRNDRAAESLRIIQAEAARIAAEGPSVEELADAKSYLIGSYPLRFDTSGKIAGQLLQIQLEELGIDWISRRNKLISAITMDDVRRVAKRLLSEAKFLAVVVGKPEGLAN